MEPMHVGTGCPPIPHLFPLSLNLNKIFYIEHWSYLIRCYMVTDFDCSTPWHVLS